MPVEFTLHLAPARELRERPIGSYRIQFRSLHLARARELRAGFACVSRRLARLHLARELRVNSHICCAGFPRVAPRTRTRVAGNPIGCLSSFPFVDDKGIVDPWVVVKEKNIDRRHLTVGQKASFGDELREHFEVEAKERQRLSEGRGKRKGKDDCPYLNGQSRDKATASQNRA